MAKRLARDGGSPTRTEPLPHVGSAAGRTLGEEEAQAAADVIRSGTLNSTVGEQVTELECEFAGMYRIGHAVASRRPGR